LLIKKIAHLEIENNNFFKLNVLLCKILVLSHGICFLFGVPLEITARHGERLREAGGVVRLLEGLNFYKK
jgi:hypothetical protein